MSIKVPLSIIDQNELIKFLHLPKSNVKFCSEKYLYPYKIVEENKIEYIYIPFGFGMKYIREKMGKDYRPARNFFQKSSFMFDNAKLREHQEVVKEEALNYINKYGHVMISTYTGFGKTIMAIKLSSMINLQVLVITKGKKLITQWKEDIEKFSSDAKVQIIMPKDEIIEGKNFYIINSINLEKIDVNFFKKIGLLIVDEAHLVMTEKCSSYFLNICPRYLISLTATPYRYDDSDKLMMLFFGYKTLEDTYSEKDNPIIYRPLERKHYVYKIYSGFTPEIRLMENGRLDWNYILEQQANNIERNNLIIKIVQRFKTNNFIILCKRISQAEYINDKLIECGEYSTILTGEKQNFDKEARILVAITQTAGTGFNHPKLDSLILATDALNYYIQFLGRVFRTETVVPNIFDILDNNNVLKKHYEKREEVYKKSMGEIKGIRIK